MGRCLSTPDWGALRQAQDERGESLDPTSFFGCEPDVYYGNQAFQEDNVGPLSSEAPSPLVDLLTCESPEEPLFSEAPAVEGPLSCEAPAFDEPLECVAPEAQVCEAPAVEEPQVCESPAATPEQAPPRTGLDAYDVVPDDFVGPLAPNQIRQSQRDTLDQYTFGQLDVVPDDFVGPVPQGTMRQSEYDRLQTGWLNIVGGTGMQVNGSAADRETFLQMTRASLGDSPTMQHLVSDIGNDTDPAHRITVQAGQHQANTIVDNFGTNTVDVDDLAFFPRTADPAHPNEMTQGEQIAHILAERRAALTSANPADFGPAHATATATHNQYRAERGQSAELSGVFGPGPSEGTTTYADGTSQVLRFDAAGNLVGTTRP